MQDHNKIDSATELSKMSFNVASLYKLFFVCCLFIVYFFIQLSLLQVPTAQLVVSDLLEGPNQTLVEWRFVSTKHGELCV